MKKSIETLSRNELKSVLGGKHEYQPQDCYCVNGSGQMEGPSFGCVTDAGCESVTNSICPNQLSICFIHNPE